MCGIFGTIQCDDGDEKKFERSVKLLHHRGPDNLKIKKWEDVTFGLRVWLFRIYQIPVISL